jgi:hypothetical protein
MPPLRTQICLTAEQRRKLDSRRKRESKSLAGVIRDAVDANLGESSDDSDRVLDKTFGSLPNLDVPPRREWQKREKRLGIRG